MSAKLILVCVLISLANTLSLMVAYHAWMGAQAHPKIARLDVAEIYRLKESEFAARLMKPGATDAERAKAIELARAFGTELTALTEHLPAECGCLVLTQAAVVGSGDEVIDLTPEVKRRLGL